MNRPKIALMTYAIDSRPAKGTALYTRKLVEKLISDNRFDFYLVHYDKAGDPLYHQAKEITMPRVRLPYASRFFSQLRFFWQYRKNKFDIIHWFQPRLYPFYWLAPAKHIVVTAHAAGDKTAPSFFNFPKIVFNFIMTWLNMWIDTAIAVSNFAKNEVVKHYRFDPKKVHITYNGGGEEFQPIDKEKALKKIQKRYSLPDSFILDVSRFQKHKNVETLIDAYTYMRNRYANQSEALVVVGSPVRNYQKPLNARGRSPYKEDIYFIDYVEQDDLNALYSAARIFVFPSLNEGFGLPIIEAMASGTPVITSNTTSLPEVAGGAALLVNPLNKKEIAEAMIKVLSKSNLYDSLVQKGLGRAMKFTWEKTAEETKEIYFKLLNESKR